jgi:hypothetical protein
VARPDSVLPLLEVHDRGPVLSAVIERAVGIRFVYSFECPLCAKTVDSGCGLVFAEGADAISQAIGTRHRGADTGVNDTHRLGTGQAQYRVELPYVRRADLLCRSRRNQLDFAEWREGPAHFEGYSGSAGREAGWTQPSSLAGQNTGRPEPG